MNRPRKQRAIGSERVDPNMPASVVITKFGGLVRFCAFTGYKTSTAWNWQVKGYIPADRQPHVLAMAELHGVSIDAADFVFQPQREVACG